jgi:hypothetical protein
MVAAGLKHIPIVGPYVMALFLRQERWLHSMGAPLQALHAREMVAITRG